MGGKHVTAQASYYYDPTRAPDRRKREPGQLSKTWKVTDIQAVHHNIIRELFKGKSNRLIALELGVSEVFVSNVKNSPAVQDRLRVLEIAADAEAVDVRKELIRRAPAALETLRELMEEKTTAGPLKARIAFDHLDRAGFGAIKQVETKNLHAHKFIDEDDIKMLKQRAIKLAEESGITI